MASATEGGQLDAAPAAPPVVEPSVVWKETVPCFVPDMLRRDPVMLKLQMSGSISVTELMRDMDVPI
jgi:hypothetical protein